MDSDACFDLYAICPACFQEYGHRFRIPMRLPCGHSVCKICLKPLSSERYACPRCKREFVLTDPVPNQEILNVIGDSEAESESTSSASNTASSSSAFFLQPTESSTLEKEILIPEWAAGAVIGKGGETIKKIQEETGTRIVLVCDSDGGQRPVRIIGDSENIEEAKRKIRRIVDYTSRFLPSEARRQVEKEFYVTHEDYEKIEAVRDRIASICDRTGTDIAVSNDPNTWLDNMRPVRITGERTGVDAAYAELVGIIDAH